MSRVFVLCYCMWTTRGCWSTSVQFTFRAAPTRRHARAGLRPRAAMRQPTRKVKWKVKWKSKWFKIFFNNFISGHGMDDHRITRCIALCKKIVSSFSYGWKRRRELAEVQIQLGLPTSDAREDVFLTPAPTRPKTFSKPPRPTRGEFWSGPPDPPNLTRKKIKIIITTNKIKSLGLRLMPNLTRN